MGFGGTPLAAISLACSDNSVMEMAQVELVRVAAARLSKDLCAIRQGLIA
jgi:hypothetical protein